MSNINENFITLSTTSGGMKIIKNTHIVSCSYDTYLECWSVTVKNSIGDGCYTISTYDCMCDILVMNSSRIKNKPLTKPNKPQTQSADTSNKYTTIVDTDGNVHQINKRSIWYVESPDRECRSYTPNKVILGKDHESTTTNKPVEIGYILTFQEPYISIGTFEGGDEILFKTI